MGDHRSVGHGTGGDYMPISGERQLLSQITGSIIKKNVLTGSIVKKKKISGSIEHWRN